MELLLNFRAGEEQAVAAAAAVQLGPAEWSSLVALSAAVVSEAERRAAGSLVLVVPSEQATHLRRELGLTEVGVPRAD